MSLNGGIANSVSYPGVITATLSLEGNKATYRAVKEALSLHSTPNCVLNIGGSATKTIKIVSIRASMAAATASQDIPYILKKCSVAVSGGTSTGSPTLVPVDSLDAAASGTVLTYTVDPTMGTLVGGVATGVINAALATVDAPQMVDIYRASSFGQSLTLRGTAENLALDLLGVALANATTANFEVEWTEE